MLRLLTEKTSIFDQVIYELRHIEIQNNRPYFRHNLKKFSRFAAYEISKTLQYRPCTVETSLGEAAGQTLHDQIVVCPILRAGLPMHDGVVDVFGQAESAFVSAYRRHHSDGSFEIYTSYLTCPDLSGKVLILTDPMLATGSSVQKALESLEAYGKPARTILLSVIGSKHGVENVQRLYPHVEIWIGAVDDELTAKAYIVPGLGDAGDLSYGIKLQD